MPKNRIRGLWAVAVEGLMTLAMVAGLGCGPPKQSQPLRPVPHAEGCDDLNPRYCSFPFPSDRYLAPDPSTPTGYRLSFSQAAVPPGPDNRPFNTEPFTRLDGFSPSAQILTMFARPVDVIASQVAGIDSIDESLGPDSPTVLIDLETGEHLPHWVEIDRRATAPDKTILYLRPANRLEDNRAYAVALRGLLAAEGTLLEPSVAFEAIRAGQLTDSTSLEARRPGLEAMFEALGAAGVERGDLQAAWWWHTASFESTHGTLLHLRDDALTRLGSGGIGCTIDASEDNFGGVSYRFVEGTITVPWYLDAADSPAYFELDGDGLPIYQGNQEVRFYVVLPNSLATAQEAGPVCIFGHGLFGSARDTVRSGAMLRLAEQEKFVFAATDWAGMSSKDIGFLAGALANTSLFYELGEHVQQGMINQIALTRTILGACRDQPALTVDGTPLIADDLTPWFVGGSQGSILGGTFLALSPDIERAGLLVGGMNFSFMIERSIHFNTFELFMDASYPDRLDQALMMVAAQHVWDRVESSSWIRYAAEGLPGIGPKQFYYIVTKNDAQVHNFSSDMAARETGIPGLTGSVWEAWDVETVDPPYAGSAYLTMDGGDVDPPPGNQAPLEDQGGHYNVPTSPAVFAMVMHFLRTGEATVICDGLCVLDDLLP